VPIQFEGLTRSGLIHLRQNHQFRLSIAQSRLLHWKMLTHSASSLSGDYATEDKALSRFMLDVTVRAAAQQRACVAEIDSLDNQMACIAAILRSQDRLMSLRQLAEEHAEMEENDNGR